MSKLVVGYIATVANPIFIDQTITQDGNSLTSNEISANYQWIDFDDNNSLIIGETNQQFTPSVSGNYAVKLSKNNCTTYSNCYSVNILNTQNYSLQNLTVFPNPVEGILSIKGIKILFLFQANISWTTTPLSKKEFNYLKARSMKKLLTFLLNLLMPATIMREYIANEVLLIFTLSASIWLLMIWILQ